ASSAKKKAGVKAYNQIGYLIGLCFVLALFFSIGIAFMQNGREAVKFVPGFVGVFIIAVLAYVAAGQSTMKEYGIGYAAWAILFGLIISNTVGTPKWMMKAVQTEYYIKTGLVLLGAEILFGKILSIGVPGIFVAWVVTPIVLVTTFIFGQKILKIPSPTLNMTISADMSVCGVSAAIATAAACRAKKEELTLAVGLSLVFTSIMMIVMPAIIKATGMPYVLGGAWMGGTIDATGAVAAAGAFLSEQALYTAATIKMIQNVLIGVIAFCVAIYWCAKYECAPGQKVRAIEIWHRFPKFVIGFIIASIIFSLMYGSMGESVGSAMIDNGVLRGFSKNFRGWFFCLAFVSIGLATNFRELKGYFKGGKPLILYFCGQSFNLALTLLMAYIMFYKVFPHITAAI
ncbi:MAG: putative sulfate exporter family transporter, partial [Deltaproteobacteria bacterium]|nr:putative sulfate exporter family transporter [Deltaproteobacteria bacterium]